MKTVSKIILSLFAIAICFVPPPVDVLTIPAAIAILGTTWGVKW